MKWHHIMESQPNDGEMIIQIDRPYEGHYLMGMREYVQKCTWEEFIDWSRKNDLLPDFWWMYAKDFPFPDKEF